MAQVTLIMVVDTAIVQEEVVILIAAVIMEEVAIRIAVVMTRGEEASARAETTRVVVTLAAALAVLKRLEKRVDPALITIKVRRSIEATRQSAIQAAIDESEEVDGFQIIVVNEKRSIETGSLADTRKRSMDTGSLASTISEISAFEKPEAAPKAGTTPA
ncbi:hypothetical protein IW141_002065 [Coemansia sp. RSA 355]|nr:hypothetical protein IW141_002065 [Coemansia sp. RSA 355]